jgi:hypothetical protein
MRNTNNVEDVTESVTESDEARYRSELDQTTRALLTGGCFLLVSGFDFMLEGPGTGTRPHARLLRDRARRRGLKQFSWSFGSAGRSMVLVVQWYRQTPGDLIDREQLARATGTVSVPHELRPDHLPHRWTAETARATRAADLLVERRQVVHERALLAQAFKRDLRGPA